MSRADVLRRALWIGCAIMGCAVAAPRTQPDTTVALEALEACLDKLNPEIDTGYDRITGRCPQLTHRLEESGWASWFPQDWKRAGNDLSAGGLRELREILVRESGRPREPSKRLSIAALPAALADLSPANSVRNGWWTRAKEWLRDAFERTQEEDDTGWLARLVGQNGLPQVVLELTSYAALLLVVLLAGIIVINELRESAVLTRLRARLTRGRSVRVAPKGGANELSWDEVCAAPLSQRPPLLLEMIIARLTAAGCLPPARALTAREVTRLARLSEAGDRQRLTQLATLSERIRFSSSPVASADVTAVIEQGEALLERLRAQALTPPVDGGS